MKQWTSLPRTAHVFLHFCITFMCHPSSVTMCTGLCDDDNITGACTQGDKVPDRSDCRFYYQCAGNVYRRTQCTPAGYGFDIDTQMCVLPFSIDCDYRCKTPVPTTAGTTEPHLTTALPQTTASPTKAWSEQTTSGPQLTTSDTMSVLMTSNQHAIHLTDSSDVRTVGTVTDNGLSTLETHGNWNNTPFTSETY